jgi:cytochrome c oxidase cbb3-type subunit 1
MHPFYVIRALGGGLFLVGSLLMAFNLWKTLSTQPAISPAETTLVPAE